MGEWVTGWMDERKGGWVGRGMEGWIEGWVDGWRDICHDLELLGKSPSGLKEITESHVCATGGLRCVLRGRRCQH